MHTYELAPNSAAAAAGKLWRRRQSNFGRRRSARGAPAGFGPRQPENDGGAAEGSIIPRLHYMQRGKNKVEFVAFFTI